MARDLLRVSMKLDRIHCYDEGDGWGDAEPYLWTVFFKIDGDSVALTDDLKLSGTATVVTTPGSHGNLGTSDVNAGENVPIPSPIGEWSPFLKPIPVPEDLKPVVGDDLGGVVGVVTVLMEEDNVTDDGAQAGRMALDSAVQSALDDIIATLGFGHTDITDDDINAYLSKMQQAISDAVEAQQSFFENVWSFLNADDLIGSRVFYFKHDDLADGEVVDFSQRWRNEGDWELFGSVNASVACTAAAAAAANEVLAKLFERTAREMRAFREREFGHQYMSAWWSLIDRNAPSSPKRSDSTRIWSSRPSRSSSSRASCATDARRSPTSTLTTLRRFCEDCTRLAAGGRGSTQAACSRSSSTCAGRRSKRPSSSWLPSAPAEIPTLQRRQLPNSGRGAHTCLG